MSRILSIDYGQKRVGIAVTDPLKIIILSFLTIICWACIPKALQAEERNNLQIDTSFIEDSGTLIPVQDPNGFLWGLKDTITGELVIPYKYHGISSFVEGRAAVSLNGLGGYINAKGKEIVSPDEHNGFEIVTDFNNGYAVVARSSNDYSYNLMNYEGKLLFKPNNGYVGAPYYKVYTDRRNMSTLRQRIIAHTKDGMRLLDFEGNFISPPVAYMRLFPNGLCMVKLTEQGKFGFWDWNGNEIHPMVFDVVVDYYMREFNEGIAIVKKNGKWGCIDESGKELFYTNYDKIESFCNGFARVTKKDKGNSDKIGYINKLGEEVLPLKYALSDKGRFVEGFAPVISTDSVKSGHNSWGFIDTTGKPITPFKYTTVTYFVNGIARVEIGKHYGFINYEGKEIIPVIYNSSGAYGAYLLGEIINDKYIFAKRDSTYDFIDFKGEIIATYNYSYMQCFFIKGKYLSFVSKNGKCGLIDFVSGQIVVPIEYDYWTNFLYDDTFGFGKGEIFGEQIQFFDINGKIVKSPPYTYTHTDTETFNNCGIAKVSNRYEKYGLINLSRKLIVPCIYDRIDKFEGGMAVVEKDGKYGFIDYSGKLVMPVIYDEVKPFETGNYSTEVVKDGETFEMDRMGNRIEEEWD